MKVLEGTRGSMIIEIEKNKVVELIGDPLIDGFYVYMDSLDFWYKPKGLPITQEERSYIISILKNHFKKNIEFEKVDEK